MPSRRQHTHPGRSNSVTKRSSNACNSAPTSPSTPTARPSRDIPSASDVNAPIMKQQPCPSPGSASAVGVSHGSHTEARAESRRKQKQQATIKPALKSVRFEQASESSKMCHAAHSSSPSKEEQLSALLTTALSEKTELESLTHNLRERCRRFLQQHAAA